MEFFLSCCEQVWKPILAFAVIFTGLFIGMTFPTITLIVVGIVLFIVCILGCLRAHHVI